MGVRRIPQMRGLPSGREAMRMMQRMGIEVEEVEGVKEVVIVKAGKRIVIEEPSVTAMKMQGQTMFQVAGGRRRDEAVAEEKVIPKEDVELVATQTGRSLDEAGKALEESGGDLAKAILLLKEKR